MKLTATCKKCGEQADFAGFVSLPRKTIFSCPACGHQSWFDGAPDQTGQPRRPDAGAQPAPEQQQRRQHQAQQQQQPQQGPEPDGPGETDPKDK